MRFWCSADGTNWSWEWRPYLGAWLFVAIIGAALWKSGAFARDMPLKRRLCAAGGLVLLLAATDWPLSRLGAGYIVTAQMIRQVLIVMIAAPMLLFGSPESWGRWLDATARRRRVVRAFSYPLVSMSTAVVLLFLVSIPVIVDPMITTQYGSFLLDVAWIGAGFLMWFPVQPPPGMTPRLQGPLSIVYLILVSIAPLPVAFFMTWSDFPIYEVYELAPRVFTDLDAKADQELAAAVFQVAGGLIVWAQIVVRFIALANRPEWGGPGDGGAGSPGGKFRGTLVTQNPATSP